MQWWWEIYKILERKKMEVLQNLYFPLFKTVLFQSFFFSLVLCETDCLHFVNLNYFTKLNFPLFKKQCYISLFLFCALWKLTVYILLCDICIIYIKIFFQQFDSGNADSFFYGSEQSICDAKYFYFSYCFLLNLFAADTNHCLREKASW